MQNNNNYITYLKLYFMMKKLYLFLAVMSITLTSYSQSDETVVTYFNSANAKFKSKDYNGAIEDLSKAIKISPNESGLYYSRGLMKDKIEDYEGAIADFSKFIEMNPRDALGYYKRGLAKFSIFDFSGAIPDFNKAIELNPKYAEAYFYKGFTNNTMGKKAEGCLDMKRAEILGYALATEYIDKFCN